MTRRNVAQRRRCLSALLVMFAGVLLAADARADLYTYELARITTNSVDQDGNPVDGAGWFCLEVGSIEGRPDQVLFRFLNNAPTSGLGSESAITSLYFYDGALVDNTNAMVSDSGGTVAFSEDKVAPKDLPGFTGTSTRVFSADADSPSTEGGAGYGVHTGEWVEVLFDLDSEKTFIDVIDSMNLTGSTTKVAGTLQIGIHVQALPGFKDDDPTTGQWLPDEGSDSFVLVPVPGAVLLGMLGLGAAGLNCADSHEPSSLQACCTVSEETSGETLLTGLRSVRSVPRVRKMKAIVP